MVRVPSSLRVKVSPFRFPGVPGTTWNTSSPTVPSSLISFRDQVIPVKISSLTPLVVLNTIPSPPIAPVPRAITRSAVAFSAPTGVHMPPLSDPTSGSSFPVRLTIARSLLSSAAVRVITKVGLSTVLPSSIAVIVTVLFASVAASGLPLRTPLVLLRAIPFQV